MKNNRNHERSYLRVPVRVVLGGNERDGKVIDHSPNGMGLILAAPVTLGEVLQVIIGADRYSGAAKFCKQLDHGRGYSVGLELTPS